MAWLLAGAECGYFGFLSETTVTATINLIASKEDTPDITANGSIIQNIVLSRPLPLTSALAVVAVNLAI